MSELSPFLKTIQERGFIRDCTDLPGMNDLLEKPGQKAYIGFDCTSDSLHVGHLIPIMLLRWFRNSGHIPIVLVGGGTTKIGDPSGKNKTRPILSDEEIEKNKEGIKKVFNKFLDKDFILVDNSEWIGNLNLVSFLRDIGKHFSINQMINQETVKSRLDKNEPFSFLEFNYTLFQAFDFLQLRKNFDCRIQMGASDQWGNILSGIDLVRKVWPWEKGGQVFGLTTHLLTKQDGTKMGKTETGAIWLDENKTSPFDFWQFWRNVDDLDVKRFLLLFTELPIQEIECITQEGGKPLNEAKKILATELTKLCHGKEIADQCLDIAKNLFENGTNIADGPTLIISKERLKEGISIIELFRTAGLAESNSDVRRLINNKGAKINDKTIDDPLLKIKKEDLPMKISAGKKKHVLVQSN